MSIRTKIVDWILQGAQPGERLIVTYGGTSAGKTVTEDTAMRLAAVNACVRVLSEDVASLPEHIYRRTRDGGKERARDHALYRLLHDAPNPEMTAFSFKQALMVNVLLSGNAYAFLEFDKAGRVLAMWPLLSSAVEPYRTEAGALMYRVQGWRDVRPEEMLHVPGLSYDGLKGLSPIAYARESIGLSKAAEEFGGRYFGNGTHLGGVIETDAALSDEAYNRLKDGFSAAYKGLQNAHGIPILEEGAKFHALGVSQQDSQFLDTRKYQRSEIAAIFRVPPHMIGDLERATFSNIEHQSIEYLQRSLMPWLVRIEQEQKRKLLSRDDQDDFVIEHDTSGFLRGDTPSRMQAYTAAVQGGIMTQNECRERENLNPKPGGDRLLQPLNMAPADERSFFRSAERRSAGTEEAAASIGVRKMSIRALRAALSAWLKEQAEALSRILKEKEPRSLDGADKILQAVNQYYEGLAKQGMPENVRKAVATICADARAKLGKQFSAEEMAGIDEEWMQGFLNHYCEDMGERLIQANRGEITRLVNNARPRDEEKLLEKLQGWGENRAAEMAETETMLAANELIVAANRKMGYVSIWVKGANCCAICTRMQGRVVARMKPPLHKGCNCTVAAKRAGAFDIRENESGTTFGIDKNGKYAKISAGNVLKDYDFTFEHWARGSKEEVMYTGEEIDDIERLVEFFGGDAAGWQKKKRIAVGEIDSETAEEDIHWYEHKDVGYVDYKCKNELTLR